MRKARVKIDWSQWNDQLGKVTDKRIAEQISCSIAAVSIHRTKLGVPSSGERRVLGLIGRSMMTY